MNKIIMNNDVLTNKGITASWGDSLSEELIKRGYSSQKTKEIVYNYLNWGNIGVPNKTQLKDIKNSLRCIKNRNKKNSKS